MHRLADVLGCRARLLVKRDDAISFAMGGNKVRKAQIVAAEALAAGADTLITTGGLQSNHARVTAAASARLGLGCILIVNGEPPARPTGNALLDSLFDADVRYVAVRDERAAAMESAAAEARHQGRHPFLIPLGASTPSGALAYVDALLELTEQDVRPDVIVCSSSSGGTQAGLVAGCALLGLPTRVIGVSADEPADVLAATVTGLLDGIERRLGLRAGSIRRHAIVEVDDGYVGPGYGIQTAASREAIGLAARTEALLLDPTYTAKAFAGLLAYVRGGRLSEISTVVFWHTGGLPGLFA